MEPQPLPESPPAKVRPVGGTEYSWCRAVPGGTGVTVLALLLSRPLPSSSLRSALRNLQSSHPILCSRLDLSSNPPAFSNPAAPGPHILSLPADATVALLDAGGDRRRPSPPADSSSLFLALLEHEMNQNPWAEPAPEPAPVLFATVYELPEPACAGSVLALRFHTAACDRTSAVAVLKELLELVGNSEEKGGAFREEGLILGIEDLIPKEDAWKPFWARGRDLFGYSLNGLRSSTLRFEETGDSDRRSEVVRLVMSSEETGRVLAACKTRGIKFCNAMSAATLLAAHSSKHLESYQQETYAVVTLIDCRKYLNPVLHEHNVGFYHSAVLNMHTIDGEEGLWDLAMRCHNSYSTAVSNKKHLTDIGELNFLMCKAIENPQLTPCSSLRTGLISVFEEPVIYESSVLQRELGVEDYIGCASVHGVGPSIAVFDTIRDGRLDCACVYPSPLHSRKQIQELVEHIKRILIEESHADGELKGT